MAYVGVVLWKSSMNHGTIRQNNTLRSHSMDGTNSLNFKINGFFLNDVFPPVSVITRAQL